MNRSWTCLRRGLLALAFAGTMGFGATQALAAPDAARFRGCPWSPNGPTFDDSCVQECQQQRFDWGYCDSGACVCMNFS